MRPVPWKFYFGRRHITDLRAWASARNITDSETLQMGLASVGVTVPIVLEECALFLPVPVSASHDEFELVTPTSDRSDETDTSQDDHETSILSKHSVKTKRLR